MKKINIFLDDCRNTPQGFIRTYTVEETISLLRQYKGMIGVVSLDNDLGEDLQEGYKVAEWLEENVMVNKYPLPERVVVHSMNPIACKRIQTIIHRLYEE